MRKIFCICFLFVTVLLTACSQADNDIVDEMPVASLQPTEPDLLSESQEAELQEVITGSVPDSISETLLDKVPELNDIAEYIDRQSKGQAHMVIEVFEPYDEQEDSYQTVYVGEEWEDGHRINWDWFYICEESGEVVANDGSYAHRLELDEWRNNESNIRRMTLIRKVLADETSKSDDLDSWIGTYSYSRYDDLGKEARYEVSVYKVINYYYAIVSVYGAEYHVFLDAGIKGSEDTIDIIYNDIAYNWSDNFPVFFSPGDILFSLSKESARISTDWAAMLLVPELSSETDGICFMRDEDESGHVTGSDVSGINLIESDDPDIAEAIQAYNDFLKGRNFVRYDGYIRMIDHITEPFSGKGCQYTLHDITGDGVPELVLAGGRLYILTYSDSQLSLWYSDEHYGGSTYFVNDGNLYYRHGGMANKLMHAYDELDSNGDSAGHFQVTLYASPDIDQEPEADSWIYTYFYSEGEEEREITEEEYDKLVQEMSNDDQIQWNHFGFPESTLRSIR